MKDIIIVHDGTLSQRDREKLSKNGSVVVECKDPSKITFKPIPLPYTFLNCYTCGDRIYITEERLAALRINGKIFYCSQGHQTVI